MPHPSGDLEDEGTKAQHRQWNRHANKYDDFFLDPFRPGVQNPIVKALKALPKPKAKSVVDLGCGTGPLLPLLVKRFGSVTAVDFTNMIRHSQDRLGIDAQKVTFLNRRMDELDDQLGKFDVAVAINSVIMPEIRVLEQTLCAIRHCLKPTGVFMGIVPSMDAIHYHTMLILDRELDKGRAPEEAERLAAYHGEHRYYDFAFGRFLFRGLKQKFWLPFEIEHRMKLAGFQAVKLDRVLYPWDDHMIGGPDFAKNPLSWDWAFFATP